MKKIAEGSPFVLLISGIFSVIAFATIPNTSEIVFDNTGLPAGITFGPSCCHVGNEIALGGTTRNISKISLFISSQDRDIVAEFETKIFANDGLDGAPGTLLWESGVLTDIPVLASDELLDVLVPNITVPDVITVTSRFISAQPVALSQIKVDATVAPDAGNFISTWYQSDDEWLQGLFWNNEYAWGLQVEAVPEPCTIVLLSLGGLLIRKVDG